jgi:2-polyprenyl-3-methyl-5-hydroxy-6-metoxy-1,4-benzoquinol methylase
MDVRTPPSEVWPEEDLERLGACPACGSRERKTLFENLADKLFGVAGRWTMHSCQGCGAAYLDPRPTDESIWRAYLNYHTHQSGGDYAPSSRQGFKAQLCNGYLNSRYGHRLPGGLAMGRLAFGLKPRSRRREDYSVRHLPAPSAADARFLDVGCGAGAFLPVAEDLGYQAQGIDPDPEAVEAARALGRNVSTGLLPNPDLAPESYEQITFNHVLEHLPRPLDTLVQAHHLLKPGGRIWLSQPNLQAIGLARYGRDWRGLEPPRHLALFDKRSLLKLLEKAGFVRPKLLPAQLSAPFYYLHSYLLSLGENPYAPTTATLPLMMRIEAMAADLAAQFNSTLGESLTVIAFKAF